MKRLIIIFMGAMLLVACGSDDVLSKDFKLDVDQVLPIIKKSHEKDKEYTDDELNILENYYQKYKLGQYYDSKNGEYHEMNNVEKAIFNKTITMKNHSIKSELEKETYVLESDQESRIDYYKESESDLKELMKIKNIYKVPDKYKGKYPTYEVVDGLYPERFEKDVIKLIDLFDPIVNGDETGVDEEAWSSLDNFLVEYKGENYYVPTEYKQNGKHYLTNESMRNVIKMFSNLDSDTDEGYIEASTIDDFNSVKEDIELL